MATPETVQLWSGPLDGARIVPTAKDMYVRFETFMDSRDGYKWNEANDTGQYYARYAQDSLGRYFYIYEAPKDRDKKARGNKR